MITDREIAGRFNALVGHRYRTLLMGGAQEPLYLPRTDRPRAIIRYTRDYAQSVLHEISHWCQAGCERRRLLDYGYWYVSPPRSSSEQAAFFRAEDELIALIDYEPTSEGVLLEGIAVNALTTLAADV